MRRSFSINTRVPSSLKTDPRVEGYVLGQYLPLLLTVSMTSFVVASTL